MSSVKPSAAARRGLVKQIYDLVTQGCAADDVDLISKALSLSSSVPYPFKLAILKRRLIRHVFLENATKVLVYVLSHSIDIKDISPDIISGAAYETGQFPYGLVEILLSHGWDINARQQRSQPLLWLIVCDGEVVKWCLEHGASVCPKGQKPWPDIDINDTKAIMEYFKVNSWTASERSDAFYYCPPILEVAARQGTVVTFELLRSKGAPLGWRTLHKAVAGWAAWARPENSVIEGRGKPLSDKERAHTREERMEMIRHLVDHLRIDVNIPDQPPGWRLGNFYGMPLHYVAFKLGTGDAKEVTFFLLDHGADPDRFSEIREMKPYGMTPMMYGNEEFRAIVEEWRLLQSSKVSKSQFSQVQ